MTSFVRVAASRVVRVVRAFGASAKNHFGTGQSKFRYTCAALALGLLIASDIPAADGEGPPGGGTSSVDIQEEYRHKIDAARGIVPLGDNLFGDSINDYTGAVQFSVTDISLPGNNSLPVALARRFNVNDVRGRMPKPRSRGGMFRDWDVDIPHLHGVFAQSTGWQAGNTPYLRCAQPNLAQAAPPSIGGFEPDDYWHGNHLYVPGHGDDEILHLDGASTSKPADGLTYRWVTKGRWYFSCLSMAGGGEAFLAHAPDGTKYWFNHFSSRVTSAARKGTSVVPRAETWIMPTRVEDRFGNWVTYTYSTVEPSNIVSISASDGRQITLTYDYPDGQGFVRSASDGSNTWTYEYVDGIIGGRLTDVVLPDNSKWAYDFSTFHEDHADQSGSGCGRAPGFIYSADFPATVTHPSGAIGNFTFNYKVHGRSYTPQSCWATSVARRHQRTWPG